MCALAAACAGEDPAAGGPRALTPEEDAAIASFLETHWARPIPLQGEPPEGPAWAPIAVDLRPEACGRCHPSQLQEWSSSLHAGAYSPGLEGQLVAHFETNPGFVESCMVCHGPLSEQLRKIERPDGGWVDNPDFDPDLERRGVQCAACHVRDWRRHGPPRPDGSLTPPPEGTPHEGAIRTTAYEDSRFCAPCHQFESPAPNGKPLENTLVEWEASRFADEGVSCQGCHMPDRRHLWRGIHDPEMTRAGVTPEWRVEGEPEGDDLLVRVALTNDGTGHRFPTYVTPAVDLEIAFVDAVGDTLARRERTLQRDVHFDGREWVEREDDRIAPGATEALEWRGPAPSGAVRVIGRARVRPDAFYTGVFRSLVGSTADTAAAKPILEEALRRTLESPYDLWRWQERLGR